VAWVDPGSGAPEKSREAWPAGIEQGTILDGKYRIERLIGHGGMGFVVEATHLLLQERVAVKFPRADLLERPDAGKRFLREARAAFALRSEHVVRILDFGVAPPGSPFIVMEYLKGKTVSELFGSRGPLGFEEAVAIVLQAVRGVQAVHDAGLVHRDLKPSNLFAVAMADGRVRIKVLDFGVATLSEGSTESEITVSGALIGSTSYMSPEQLRAEAVDARSDVWALGIVLYELLSGQRPFSAPSNSALIAKILVDPPAPLRGLVEVPSQMAAIVNRCLSKNPNDRYRSVEHLRRALAELVPGEDVFLPAEDQSTAVPLLANSTASGPVSTTLASVLRESRAATLAPRRIRSLVTALLVGGVLLGILIARPLVRSRPVPPAASPFAASSVAPPAAASGRVESSAYVAPRVQPLESVSRAKAADAVRHSTPLPHRTPRPIAPGVASSSIDRATETRR
jgi:eukaryotic-like serine/threonine-protein kinase